MIILDTCAMVFDGLMPNKLTKTAKKAIDSAQKKNQLYCCDISLWEIAMLIQKKRLDPGYETVLFLQDLLDARQMQVLNINVEIAAILSSYSGWAHYDPADRIIAATAIYHKAKLVTCDKKLRAISDITVIW